MASNITNCSEFKLSEILIFSKVEYILQISGHAKRPSHAIFCRVRNSLSINFTLMVPDLSVCKYYMLNISVCKCYMHINIGTHTHTDTSQVDCEQIFESSQFIQG